MTATLSKPPSAAIDLDIASFDLNVVGAKPGLGFNLSDVIVSGELERTIDVASTLTVTVHDPRQIYLRSGLFNQPVEVKLDKLFFRLVQVSKSGTDLTLTFEDREVALLRQAFGPKKAGGPAPPVKLESAQRSKSTRAEFALSLVRETLGNAPFICPQLHTQQPIAGGKTDVRKNRRTLPYQFKRDKVNGVVEDTWTCIQRLASEVQWHCFCVAGAIHFVSDSDLFGPVMQNKEFPAMTLSETSPGVVSIDFDIDSGKATSDATVTASASRWEAEPGAIVRLQDLGPASDPTKDKDTGITNDLWVVSDMRRSLYDSNASVTLRRFTKPLLEPAPSQVALVATPRSGPGGTRSVVYLPGPATTGSDVFGYSTPQNVINAWKVAKGIDSQHLPYVWDGGHGLAGIPTNGGIPGGPVGYDCSGAVSAVCSLAGGLGFDQVSLGPHSSGAKGISSTGFLSWGDAGEGDYITVWTNVDHVFLDFIDQNGKHYYWAATTSRYPAGGPGFKASLADAGCPSLAFFFPRHWPNT